MRVRYRAYAATHKNCSLNTQKLFHVLDLNPILACVAGGIRGYKGGSLKYRLPTAGHFVRSMRQIWRAIPEARE